MIASLYAGLLTFLYIYLAIRVIARRRAVRIGLGDEGDAILLRAIRAHGNLAEYVPLALVLMILAELDAAPDYLVHGVGLCLLAGRCLHAYGVSREAEESPGRFMGMILTFTALLIAAAVCVIGFLAAFPG